MKAKENKEYCFMRNVFDLTCICYVCKKKIKADDKILVDDKRGIKHENESNCVLEVL